MGSYDKTGSGPDGYSEKFPTPETVSRAKAKLFDLTPDLMCVASLEGHFEVLNDAFAKTLGYEVEELLGTPYLDIVHPDDIKETLRELKQVREGYCSIEFENRFLRKDGSAIHLSWTIYPDLDQESIYAVAKDISSRKKAEFELLRSNKMLRALFQAQSAFITSENRYLLFSNLLEAILRLTGSEYGFIGEVLFTEKEAPYLKTHAITNIAWDSETQKLYDQNAEQGMEFHNLETLFGRVMTTGKAVIANDAANDPRGAGVPKGHPALDSFLGLPFHVGSELVGMVGIANREGGYDEALVEYLEPFLSTCANLVHGYRSLREREETDAELHRIASSDALTNLSNRRSFLKRLKEETDRSRRHSIPLSLLMVDLDHFKKVNDTYGHDCGDDVLKETANVLRESCRSIDLPARLGGEEFAVLLPQTMMGPAVHVAERIRTSLAEREFTSHAGVDFSVTCSVGVAELAASGADIDALLKAADEALYLAKEHGRNRVSGIIGLP